MTTQCVMGSHKCMVYRKNTVRNTDLFSHTFIQKDQTCTSQEKQFPTQWRPTFIPDKNIFSRERLYEQHQHVHINDMRGELCHCRVCSKSFALLSNRHCHMSTHPGKGPYNCKNCEKSFISSSALAQHKCIHTEKKPYTCATCHKPFTQSKYLRHLLVHTGLK